jgi:hypothetical protein
MILNMLKKIELHRNHDDWLQRFFIEARTLKIYYRLRL